MVHKDDDEIVVDMVMARGRNPITGHIEYTDKQLEEFLPRWTRDWEKATRIDLPGGKVTHTIDEELRKNMIHELHMGPEDWPGDRILKGSDEGYKKFRHEVVMEFREKLHHEGKKILNRIRTESKTHIDEREAQLVYIEIEACKRLNEQTRRMAQHLDHDPFGFEYYLTPHQRQKGRVLIKKLGRIEQSITELRENKGKNE